MINGESTYCVYKHTSPSGKVYIGITNKQPPEKRWYSNGSGYKRQLLFWRAIQKYGWENFQHEILFENLTKEIACQKEIELIKIYDSTNPDKGYNCSSGGENSLSGVQWTDIMKNNRSKLYTGEGNPFYGKKHSEESKEKMSQYHKGQEAPNKGKSPSDETLQLWSKQRKGKVYGVKRPKTNEEKIKSSNAHNFQKKPIILMDENENIIAEYDSISQASKLTGVDVGSISGYCRGVHKPINGQIWRYKYENDALICETKSQSKAIVQFDKNNTLIAEYNSISEAARITGVSFSGISACCRYKRLTAGGFIWRYKEDEQNSED